MLDLGDTLGKYRESQKMMKTASHWLGFTLPMDSSILPSHIFEGTYYGFSASLGAIGL